jgi:hypothetical protein
MKFSKLAQKFEELTGKHEQGSTIKPDKLDKLRQLLGDKKSHYREKLAATDDPDKRQKLERRLRVVSAQLDKLKRLSQSQ